MKDSTHSNTTTLVELQDGSLDTMTEGEWKKKKHKKKKRSKELDGDTEDVVNQKDGGPEGKKDKKKSKKNMKKKRKADETNSDTNFLERNKPKKRKKQSKVDSDVGEHQQEAFTFDFKYILAPMVGASELAFRLLCRKYGTQLAYTPMMSSTSFATDPAYREREFQTIPEDRPLVCHFSANDPKEFAAAAKLVEDKCDAIDLNLGCPQRTAYLGHFGSYLLDPKDRDLICNIVREASKTVSIPIFCKIRLLDTLEDTIQLCRQLIDAGASLIAIHARYRASFERKGAGARDGPAMLDQVLQIKKVLGDFPIISNGNIITYDDVENNIEFTGADGVMSAEGILDNPALYLPQHGNETDEKEVQIAIPSELVGKAHDKHFKLRRKLSKKIRDIEAIEKKLEKGEIKEGDLFAEQENKLRSKPSLLQELEKIADSGNESKSGRQDVRTKRVPLTDLYRSSSNKIDLATEYLSLAQTYPTVIRTVVFHTRRMLKEPLNRFQLMSECIACTSIGEVKTVLEKIKKYEKDPFSFKFDKEKEKLEKEALKRKKEEEGKRKRYEERMVRKAKREGRTDDVEYYLRQGSTVPTKEVIKCLRVLPKREQLERWKVGNHSQHCLAYHLEEGGCKRHRGCAFLHVDPKGGNSFEEQDEVAG